MDELLQDFKAECHDLAAQLTQILESIEGDYSQVQKLETYGQIVDRIMGAAKNLSLAASEQKDVLEKIAVYCELCKQIAYKGSQVNNNESLFNVTIALLMDATEVLEDMVNHLGQKSELSLKAYLTSTFQERLKWLNSQFSPNLRGTLALDPLQEFDSLLKALMK
jgi:chemotaxis protein histidine kinase CheA